MLCSQYCVIRCYLASLAGDVWQGAPFCWKTKSRLVVTSSPDEILDQKVLQSAEDILGEDVTTRRDFIIQQDGAPCNISHGSMEWLRDHNINVLDWPGSIPDLNISENLWSRLKRPDALKKASNHSELTAATTQSWFRVITPEHLEQLVSSIIYAKEM